MRQQVVTTIELDIPRRSILAIDWHSDGPESWGVPYWFSLIDRLQSTIILSEASLALRSPGWQNMPEQDFRKADPDMLLDRLLCGEQVAYLH